MTEQKKAKDKKADSSFGLDPKIVSGLNWERAIDRILHDMRSDFIWAPHLRFLYQSQRKSLIELVSNELCSGVFHAGIPLTIEVPKSFRIKVGGNAKRLGPSFTRPGSILPPKDRLFYQVIADEALELIEEKTDKSRSFSHRAAGEEDDAMFLSNRKCWSELQKALDEHAQDPKSKYILKLDVADYFGSVNQHTLINTLKGFEFSDALADRLEKLLLSYTGQRSSRGILQGIYPSDLFGAFYMTPVDRFFDDRDIPSARYVDDIYVFVGSVDDADRVMRELIPFLRSYDLNLNEVKSSVMPKSALFAEEPDLEKLFSDAVAEISSQIADEAADTDYGFQSDWLDEDEEENEALEELELQATRDLFDSIDDFPGHEEVIERFCLPLFTKAEDEYGVNYVLDQLKRRPSMTQIYAAYLGKFVADDADIRDALLDGLSDTALYDWQKMWIVATLMQAGKADGKTVKAVYSLLNDATRHDALRAAAALFVGVRGDHDRRKALFGIYPNVSGYVQLAIYFSSRSWPKPEKANARDTWGGHDQLHKLMSKGLSAL